MAPSSVVEEEEELEVGGDELSNRRHRSNVTAEGGLCRLPMRGGGGGEREEEYGAGGRNSHRVQRELATQGESRGLRGG